MKMGILILVMLTAVLATSCSSDVDGPSSEMSCRFSITCSRTGEAVNACCNSKECEYRVGSKTIPCGGTDCESAAKVMAQYCL